jgi:hypothetical protein
MAFIRSLLLLVAIASGLLLASFTFQTRTEASSQEVVRLQMPDFVQVGRRYAFTWAGGGPAQTYTVKSKRQDGWILVEVADENTNPIYFVPGELPTRWLNVAMAISVQEMRPHQ